MKSLEHSDDVAIGPASKKSGFGVWIAGFWWARGVISAFAIAGVLATLPGFPLSKVFDLVAAFNRAWSGLLLAWLTDFWHLFSVTIWASRAGINVVVVLLLVGIPGYFAGSWGLWRFLQRQTSDIDDPQLNEQPRQPWWLRHRFMLYLVILVWLYIALKVLWSCGKVLFTEGGEQEFLRDAASGGVGTWSLLVVAIGCLWFGARTYAKALFTSLTFIIAFGAFHYMPLLSPYFDKAVAWLDERGDSP